MSSLSPAKYYPAAPCVCQTGESRPGFILLMKASRTILKAASEDIPIVRRPDRKDLLGYLKVVGL